MQRLAAWLVAGVTLACSGCSTPEPRAEFDSDDPAERLLALERSIREPRRDDVPHVIAMLDSADGAVRMLAARHLEHLTGETRGYHHGDPGPARTQAVERWVAWWNDGADGLRLEGM